MEEIGRVVIAYLMWAVMAGVYFLPTFLALGRKIKNKSFNGISLINIFLGWTFIGWIGAIVWAFMAQKKDI